MEQINERIIFLKCMYCPKNWHCKLQDEDREKECSYANGGLRDEKEKKKQW